MQREYDLPHLRRHSSTAKKAAMVTKNNRIGVIGTNATIRGRAYDGIIREVNPRAQVRSVACPLLVPLVENFRTRPGDLVVEQVVREYLQPLKDWGCDTLVLGCTHYPLLWDVIGAFMGPEVTLVNSGKEAGMSAGGNAETGGMLSGAVSGGTCKFYVSDTTEGLFPDGLGLPGEAGGGAGGEN